MPTLSVIIPNYNHEKYLPEALYAILSQSLKPSEILVVDDASTDKSCEIVKEYQKKHSHLTLLKMKKNSGGPIVPVQEGLKMVTGDYVALCASDDMIQPGFFKESMECVALHPEVGICFGKFVIFEDQKPYRFNEITISLIDRKQIYSPDEWVKISRKYHLDIPSQSALYRRDLLMGVGGYDEKLKGYSDYYVNYQLSFLYPVAFVPKVWGANRVVPFSYGRDLDPQERYDLCRKLMKKLENEPKILQKRWRKSGILARAGRGMFDYLLHHRKYWKFLPLVLTKYISFKTKKYLLTRSK